MEFFQQVNWVDLLLLGLSLRILYSAIQTGFVVEFLNLGAAFLALVVAFHYYASLAELAGKNINAVPVVMRTGSFLMLVAFTLVVCYLIRYGLFLVFSVEAQQAVDKWGAALLAVLRVFLAGSMILFALLLTESHYLKSMVARSWAGSRMYSVAPAIYKVVCRGIIVRLFPGEHQNAAIDEILKSMRP